MKKLIWQELTKEQKLQIENTYKNISKQIQSLNANKANYEKTQKYTEQQTLLYKQQIQDLQKQYENININYRCDFCNNIIELPFSKLKLLIKGNTKPIFCSRSCSGKYYANKQHNERTQEQQNKINSKISNTLKNNSNKLTPEQFQLKINNLNKYWKNLTPEQRSIRNKKLVFKSKQTKLKRYGNENYHNVEKMKLTYKKNNTIYNPAKNWSHIKTESLKIIRNKELFKQFILTIPLEDRCIYTIAKKLGISRSYCSTLINKYNLYNEEDVKIHRNLSQPQIELQEYISSICNEDIIINTKKIITPYELDIYIPNKNLAIEFNGNYYHTTNNVDKKAHYNKSKLCEEKGIRLIHIFEYEWNNERQRPILENIIKNALGVNEHKLFARNLDIEERPSNSMKDFFNKNNIQGFRGGKVAICLVDKITRQVYMSYIMGNAFFGKGKYEWEVIRGATELGYTVIGGASKIWKYFINNYDPNSCVYYIDYNYFNGSSMKNLSNIKFLQTQFSFKNYWVKEGIVKNRQPNKHKEIKELEKQGLVYPIYNAGTKVYVWQKNL